MAKNKDSIPKDTQKKKGRVENLIPGNKRTPEEARELGRLGGIKSGEVRKEKRLMSMILADYIARTHKVETRTNEGVILDAKEMTTDELVDYSITSALARGDSASMSAIKIITETTEGKNINLTGSLSIKQYDMSKLSEEELAALEAIGSKVANDAESD